jgi:hypothetical protein
MTVHSWKTAALDPVQQRPAGLDAGTDAHVRFLDPSNPTPDPHSGPIGFADRVTVGTDSLLYLTSGGPDAGCQRLVVSDVALSNGTLSLDANVRCEAGMAAQVITYPASVLWIPDAVVDHVTASVVDGWEQSHTVEVTSEGA